MVGADDDPANANGFVQRSECNDHLSRAAVGAGDDALVTIDRFGVHFGDDQRDGWVHPPIRTLVDHDRAGFDRPRRELSGDLIGRASDDQVDAFKGGWFHQLDGQHFVAVTNLGAGAASRGKQTQFPHGELASVELVQNDSANGTGGTDECNAIKHEWSGDGETKWGGKRVFSR